MLQKKKIYLRNSQIHCFNNIEQIFEYVYFDYIS